MKQTKSTQKRTSILSEFHLSKRSMLPGWQTWLIRGSSILVAIIIGGLVFLIIGKNPFAAYSQMISGSLSKALYLRQTVKIAIPLLGTALAIAPCFKMRFWNIGAEGQITAGGIGSMWAALMFQDKLASAPWLLLLVMCACGAIAGAAWAFLPAFFKAKWGTNETLFTLMFNYIIIGFVKYLQGGPWEGVPGSQIIPQISEAARLPVFPADFKVHIGWIVVLVMVVFIFVYMKYTKHGYEIQVIGESANTAKYAGMNVTWITIRTMLLSGAMCGIVGFLLISGQNFKLNDAIAGGVGFTAITVAWLSQLNPFVMVAVSMLLAIFQKGAQVLSTKMAVPETVSSVVTGIFLFTMLACEFFINYKISIKGRLKKIGEKEVAVK